VTSTRSRLRPAVATRTFSFRGESDLGERHGRALSELERLRRERPRLADSVHYDFDVRLAMAQRAGLASPAERLHATVTALVEAVEDALTDEALFEQPGLPLDDELLAAARPSETEAA
jgi:hypothetical protein